MMVLTFAASPLYAQDTEARSEAREGAAQDTNARDTNARAGAQESTTKAADTSARAGEKRAAVGGSQQLSDGQILQIVRTLNDGEIKQAEEAKDEGESEAVKQVAEMIITDHEMSNEQMDELLNGDLNLDDSPMSDMLKDQAEETHELLQDLAGAQYDCAYLQAQVSQHQMAIDTAKSQLLPNAKAEGVKQFLTAMEPKLQHHLQMAQDAMGKMQGCSNPQSQQSSAAPANQSQPTQQSQAPATRSQQ